MAELQSAHSQVSGLCDGDLSSVECMHGWYHIIVSFQLLFEAKEETHDERRVTMLKAQVLQLERQVRMYVRTSNSNGVIDLIEYISPQLLIQGDVIERQNKMLLGAANTITAAMARVEAIKADLFVQFNFG